MKTMHLVESTHETGRGTHRSIERLSQLEDEVINSRSIIRQLPSQLTTYQYTCKNTQTTTSDMPNMSKNRSRREEYNIRESQASEMVDRVEKMYVLSQQAP